jgi:hypothetical protein
VAAIEVQLEQAEAKMSEGDLTVDLDQYSRKRAFGLAKPSPLPTSRSTTLLRLVWPECLARC